MLSTYCTEITTAILSDYIRVNLIAILINDEDLGYTDEPTPLELYNRKLLTMDYIITKELTLNGGYSRAICTIDSIELESENNRARLFTRAEFNPTGQYDPATHVVYVCRANLVGADPIINGNNRGDNIGKVIKVVPLENAPITLITPIPYIYLADISIRF